MPYLRQMQFSLYEIATVEYMKKTLKPGDIFIDVGAHIGYLSAVGASMVKKTGRVYGFEPAPLLFSYLRKLVEANPEYHIEVDNHALGEGAGTSILDYSPPPQTGGSSMIRGFHHNPRREYLEVSVARLDERIKKYHLENVALIKIDVEGYEFPVLKGLQNYFEETDYRPVIICEITPSAYPLLGISREELIEYMARYGYGPYDIYNPKRKIDITKFKEGANVVWKVNSD